MKSFYIFNVLPGKVKSTIWFSVLITVIQFSLDCFLAYVITSIDELDQIYMVLFAIIAVISVISRPFVLITQHWAMRRGTVQSVELILSNLFNKPISGDNQKQFVSELLLKTNNISIYIIQPIIHFFSSLINISLAVFTLLIISFQFTINAISIGFLVLLVFYFSVRNYNKKLGDLLKLYQDSLGSTATNFVEGRKELFNRANSKILIIKYLKLEDKYRKTINSQRFLSQYPKQGIESIIIAVLIFSSIYDLDLNLITIASISLIGIRTLPQIGNLIASSSSIASYTTSTLSVYEGVQKKYKNNYRKISSDKNLITIKNISLKHTSVRHFSSSINIESKTVITSRSGYGKTSIFDAISGILHNNNIECGEILLPTFNIYYLQQESYLLEDTLGLNIFLTNNWDELEQSKITEAKELLNRFELNINLEDKVSKNKLSGGERQRVAILRMLMSNSDIVLFDEGFSALNLELSKIVMNTVLQSSKTIIMTVHNQELIKMYSDKLKIINLN
jgi:ABC-type transport system involved in cytochrome bd biosynthesis fused ATPase/permease subunit